MTLDKFIEYLHEQEANGSIYVWGGQGQTGDQITEAWIRSRETSTTNANRAITFWKAQKAKGYTNLRAFDCSGLGMYFLQNLHSIYQTDMTSATMRSKCTKISRSELKKGDWVFRLDSKGNTYHIGFVVDDNLNVIEAMGRDVGVVKRHIDASGANYWNAFGRPECFAAEIEGNAPAPSPAPAPTPTPAPTETAKDRKKQVQTAINTAYNCGLVVDGILGTKSKKAINANLLKLKNILMRGAYVKWVQERLIKLGYSVGSLGADGVFGKNTKAAVMAFQNTRGLDTDGIVGWDTINALVA